MEQEPKPKFRIEQLLNAQFTAGWSAKDWRNTEKYIRRNRDAIAAGTDPKIHENEPVLIGCMITFCHAKYLKLLGVL